MTDPRTEQDSTPTEPTNPVEAIFQAVGHASVCWVGGPGDAVFDEQEAIKVANDLIAYLTENPLRDPAGVVRVDTRNPATIERIARQLLINDHPEHPNDYWQPHDWEPYEDAASAVLAALTEEQPK